MPLGKAGQMVRRMDSERLKRADFGRVQVRLHNDEDKIAHHWFQETDPKLYRQFLTAAEKAVLPELKRYLEILKAQKDAQSSLWH